jgi:hypothetical protein
MHVEDACIFTKICLLGLLRTFSLIWSIYILNEPKIALW